MVGDFVSDEFFAVLPGWIGRGAIDLPGLKEKYGDGGEKSQSKGGAFKDIPEKGKYFGDQFHVIGILIGR